MNSLAPYNFPQQVAWKTLNLLIERKALLHPAGVVFYVWQRGERLIVAFDPSAIDTAKVNEDFAHRLATRLHGRRVIRTNSRGMFRQVGFEIPDAPRALEIISLDLMKQPTPWHVPVGMTKEGPLWISFIEGDSYLIGGSRGGGKTGEEHAWIQALLHGGQTLVYAWDGKRGAEFGRYAGRQNFHLLLGGMKCLSELETLLKEREKKLTESGFPNTVMYNEAPHPRTLMLPIALFVDEAADLPNQAKQLLEGMIRLYRHAGMYPVIATNQPTVASVFTKTNLSTRVAFRVPHHNDSVTMLGYKGAEALPDVRGRGLIVWKGNFIEFQSFEVTYPMPEPGAIQSILEEQTEEPLAVIDQPLAEDDKSELIIKLHEEGKSNTAIVYEIWGKSGSNFAERMEQVKAILSTAATATASEAPNLPLNGALA